MVAQHRHAFFLLSSRSGDLGFDPADRGSWRVLFDANGPAGEPATAPNGLVVFGEIPIGFRAAMSIPDSQRLEEHGGRVSDAVFDAIEAERATLFGDAARHQLGGYPQPVQNDGMELECELVSNGINCGSPEGYQSAAAAELSSAGGARAWRLLLQLDSDDDADMMWGDSGMLYFWVREADARARDFAATWMILQCC